MRASLVGPVQWFSVFDDPREMQDVEGPIELKFKDGRTLRATLWFDWDWDLDDGHGGDEYQVICLKDVDDSVSFYGAEWWKPLPKTGHYEAVGSGKPLRIAKP